MHAMSTPPAPFPLPICRVSSSSAPASVELGLARGFSAVALPAGGVFVAGTGICATNRPSSRRPRYQHSAYDCRRSQQVGEAICRA